MSRRIPCPWPGLDAWVDLPDSWLGDHADRRDTAADQSKERNLKPTLANFATSLALLDNWRIPGLEGNPDAWDFTKLDLRLIAWVNDVVLTDYWKCFTIPKNSYPPSQNGQAAAGVENPLMTSPATT